MELMFNQGFNPLIINSRMKAIIVGYTLVWTLGKQEKFYFEE